MQSTLETLIDEHYAHTVCVYVCACVQVHIISPLQKNVCILVILHS